MAENPKDFVNGAPTDPVDNLADAKRAALERTLNEEAAKILKRFPSTFMEKTTGTIVHFAEKTPSIGLQFGSPLEDDACPHCKRPGVVLTVREVRGFYDDGCRILVAKHTGDMLRPYDSEPSSCEGPIEFEEQCARSFTTYGGHEQEGKPPIKFTKDGLDLGGRTIAEAYGPLRKICGPVSGPAEEQNEPSAEIEKLQESCEHIEKKADDLSRENERLRAAIVKRKFRLELVNRRVTEVEGGKVTAHEFEAVDGAPAYLVVVRERGEKASHWSGVVRELNRRLGEDRVTLIVADSGLEIQPFELVPVDPLPEDFVPREEVRRRLADQVKAKAEECLKEILKDGVIPTARGAVSMGYDIFAGPEKRLEDGFSSALQGIHDGVDRELTRTEAAGKDVDAVSEGLSDGDAYRAEAQWALTAVARARDFYSGLPDTGLDKTAPDRALVEWSPYSCDSISAVMSGNRYEDGWWLVVHADTFQWFVYRGHGVVKDGTSASVEAAKLAAYEAYMRVVTEKK